MKKAICLILFTSFLTPSVLLANGETCFEIFKKERPSIELTPREQVVKAVLWGNLQMPQHGLGIRLALVNAILKNPKIMKFALEEPTKAELDELAEKMNRAHAAYGVQYRSAGNPEAQPNFTVEIGRFIELSRQTQRWTIISVVALAARLEPKNHLWEDLKKADPTSMFHDFADILPQLEKIIPELEKFFERKKLNDPTSTLGAFRIVLEATLASPELRDFNQQHRENLRKLNAGDKTLTQEEIAVALETALKDIFTLYTERLLPPQQRRRVLVLFDNSNSV